MSDGCNWGAKRCSKPSNTPAGLRVAVGSDAKDWWRRRRPEQAGAGTGSDVLVAGTSRLRQALAETRRRIGPSRSALARMLPLLGAAALIANIAVNVLWVATARDGLKDLGSFLHS